MPAGAWRSTSASRASRWPVASAADRGRGPTMAPMIASAAARSTGRPSRPSSTQSTSAADSARAVAATWRWSATSAASCVLLGVRHLQRQLGPRRGAIGRRRPLAGRPLRPQVAVGADRLGELGGRRALIEEVRWLGAGHGVRVELVGQRPDERRVGPPSAVEQAVHRGEVEGSSDRHVVEHRADRWRRPPHPPGSDRRLDVPHVGDVDGSRPGGAHRHDAVGRRRHEGDRFAATGERHPRSSSPRT